MMYKNIVKSVLQVLKKRVYSTRSNDLFGRFSHRTSLLFKLKMKKHCKLCFSVLKQHFKKIFFILSRLISLNAFIYCFFRIWFFTRRKANFLQFQCFTFFLFTRYSFITRSFPFFK